MNHAAFAHAAVEVAVGGRGADFARSQNTVAHAEAGTAGGVGDAETGIHEYCDDAFSQSIAEDLGGSRGNDRPDTRSDVLAAQNFGSDAEVFQTAVSAASDVNLIDGGSGEFTNRFDLIPLLYSLYTW